MKVRHLKIPMGGDIAGVQRTKYKVILEDSISDPSTHQYHISQQQFLNLILNNPNLLICGIRPFDRLKMYHTGERWVLEAEAESVNESSKENPA